MSGWIVTIGTVLALGIMTALALAAPVGHGGSKYTQVGKDCVVSSNGSARVARNTECPKEQRQ